MSVTGCSAMTEKCSWAFPRVSHLHRVIRGIGGSRPDTARRDRHLGVADTTRRGGVCDHHGRRRLCLIYPARKGRTLSVPPLCLSLRHSSPIRVGRSWHSTRAPRLSRNNPWIVPNQAGPRVVSG